MPRIENIRMDLPYAANTAEQTFSGELISANYNVGGQYPQPSGLTVIWYGTIDFEEGCSATFGQANLTAKIVGGKLARNKAYSLLFYDLENNLLQVVQLGAPPKDGSFTFPTLFENNFTSSPCGANIEIGY